MTRIRSYLLVCAALILPALGEAQCGFDLGNDTVVCGGLSLGLAAPAGYLAYQWNTGSNSAGIVADTSGTYICDVVEFNALNNVIVNGDFSAGNTGFTSGYAFAPGGTWGPVSSNGSYTVVSDPSTAHGAFPACGDHTTGSGNMLVVNGAANATIAFWCQSVTVAPNTDYLFSYWQVNITDANPAEIVVEVNGIQIAPGYTAAPISCQWEPVIIPWNSGASSIATFCFFDLTTAGHGNDMGVDDISLIPFCYASDTIQVLFQSYPVVDLGPDTTICTNAPITLVASQSGASYLWHDGSTGSTMAAQAAGLYWVQVSINGCASADSTMISTWLMPIVNLGNDTSICVGESVQLGSQTAGASYSWSSGATTGSITVSNSGTYWLDVTANGCTVRDSIYITVIPLPLVELGNDTSICADGSLHLDATLFGGSYIWNTGNTSSNVWAVPDSIYWVEVTANGCTAKDSIVIGSHQLPSVNLPADSMLCPGEVVSLNASITNGSYLWQDGSTAPTYSASVGVTHVTVTDQNLCAASDTILMTAAPTAIINLGPDVWVCPEDSVLLDATFPGAHFLWSTNDTVTSIYTSAGTFNVAATLGSCITYDTVVVAHHAVASIDLGADTTLCPGEHMLLQPPSSSSLVWHNGGTGPTFNVTQAGLVWVQATDMNGCVASDSVRVYYASPGSVDLGNDTAICTGTTIMLDATAPGAWVLWDNGSTAFTKTVASAGTYQVVVTTGNCWTSDSIQVSLLALPTVDLGNDTSICPAATIPLNATISSGSYVWQNSATSAIIQAPAGVHSVVVTDANGCYATDAITIGTLPVTPIYLGADVVLCNGDSTVLNAGSLSSGYLWNTGEITTSITVNSDGNYSVDAMQGPCPVGDTISVQLLPIPVVNLGPDTTLCDGEVLMLDATSVVASSYQWQNGDTTANLSVSSAGIYFVEATSGSCSDQDTVQVNYLPLPVVDIGADSALCTGDGRMLDATTGNATYLWNNGSTAADIWLEAGQSASVIVTVNGCNTADNIIFTAIPLPAFDLGNDTMLCRNETIQLQGPASMDSYQWSSGSTSSAINISTASMSVLQVQQYGCTFTDSIEVAYVPLPAVDLGPDTVICPYQQLDLTTSIPNANILWSTGNTSPIITVTSPDNYWVRATMLHCVETDTMVVEVEDIAFPDLGPDVSTCSNDPITLSVAPGNAQVLWSTGSQVASILVQDSALYWVTLTQNYCLTADSVVIDIIPLMEEVSIGPNVTICHDAEARFSAFIPTAQYLWSTGDIIPNITVNEAGMYTLHATGYCIDAWDTAWVNVIDCGPYVHVPNAFTPNGDQLNESFGAVVAEDLEEFELLIFNRWGEVLFRSTDPNHGWDGISNGKPVPTGVYPWKLIFRRSTEFGPKREKRTGHVTLLR